MCVCFFACLRVFVRACVRACMHAFTYVCVTFCLLYIKVCSYTVQYPNLLIVLHFTPWQTCSITHHLGLPGMRLCPQSHHPITDTQRTCHPSCCLYSLCPQSHHPITDTQRTCHPSCCLYSLCPQSHHPITDTQRTCHPSCCLYSLCPQSHHPITDTPRTCHPSCCLYSRDGARTSLHRHIIPRARRQVRLPLQPHRPGHGPRLHGLSVANSDRPRPPSGHQPHRLRLRNDGAYERPVE